LIKGSSRNNEASTDTGKEVAMLLSGEDALGQIKAGRMVILVDDEDRENGRLDRRPST
jgi:hypothetical protein